MVGYELCWSKDLKMAPGTNRLPHSPMTSEIKFQYVTNQLGLTLCSFPNLGTLSCVEKIWDWIIYASTFSRRAVSSCLLSHTLSGLISQPCHGLLTQRKGTYRKTVCSHETTPASTFSVRIFSGLAVHSKVWRKGKFQRRGAKAKLLMTLISMFSFCFLCLDDINAFTSSPWRNRERWHQ